MINVEVQRNNNENAANVIKRFTKRVQGAGILNKVRGIRYAKRDESRYVRKKKALKTLTRRKNYEEMVKMGKIADRSERSR